MSGQYGEAVQKERLFHGIYQTLKDSVWFGYKRTDSTYQDLLTKALDAEKEKCLEQKGTTIKAKSSVADVDETSRIQGLAKKIDDLTAAVKSSTYQGVRPKKPQNDNNHNNKFCSKKLNNSGINSKLLSPYKGKGPTTTSAGPFRQGKKPFQCHQCGG